MPVRPAIWPTMTAFAAIAVAFLTAIVISQHAASEIRLIVDEITENATPSVEALTRVRSAMTRLQVQLRRAQSEPGSEALEEARKFLATIDEGWGLIDAKPLLVGEGSLRKEARAKMEHLRSVARRAIEALETAETEHARALLPQQLSESFAESAVVIDDLVKLNVRHGHAAAVRVEETRRAAAREAYFVGALALLLTLVVALRIRRSLVTYSALLGEHLRLQQERSSELETFAARMAHDVRSPLAAALLACQAAERSQSLGDACKQTISRATTGIRRASRLVDGLYEFARSGGQAAAGSTTPLVEAVQQAVDEIASRAETAGLTIRVTEIPDVQAAMTSGVLASIVSNLLGNAVKYAGPGARITVRARANERLRVEVEDTGVGMTPEIQARIFHPYVREDRAGADGLGLGLATVKRLVEGYNGTCGVRSAPGQGSTFWFEVPTARPRSPPDNVGLH